MVELNNKRGVINTFMGLEFDLFNPKPEMIHIKDIARGLAFNGRFAGHTPQYYSVAQHSVLVCDLILKEHSIKTHPKLALAGLLHDAAESYIGDMITPLKKVIPEFKRIENNILKVVFEKYGLESWLMNHVKSYDERSLIMEFEAFYKDAPLFNQLDPEYAYVEFLEKFKSVCHGIF